MLIKLFTIMIVLPSINRNRPSKNSTKYAMKENEFLKKNEKKRRDNQEQQHVRNWHEMKARTR